MLCAGPPNGPPTTFSLQCTLIICTIYGFGGVVFSFFFNFNQAHSSVSPVTSSSILTLTTSHAYVREFKTRLVDFQEWCTQSTSFPQSNRARFPHGVLAIQTANYQIKSVVNITSIEQIIYIILPLCNLNQSVDCLSSMVFYPHLVYIEKWDNEFKYPFSCYKLTLSYCNHYKPKFLFILFEYHFFMYQCFN